MTANFHPRGPSESEIHSRLETAITRAVSAEELPKQKKAHIKRQKYAYLLLDRFSNIADPPVTYSWFKWGASEWAGPSTNSPKRTLRAEYPQANQLLEIDSGKLETYLRSGLDELTLQEWWEADFLYFLEEFYTHYGHPDYKNLYLENIRLLQLMDDVITTMELGRNSVRSETVEDAKSHLQTITGEIKNIQHLENHNRFVDQFSDLFGGVMTELESFEGESIDQGHITTLRKLREFYRDHVWMIVASSISQYTAKGPNSSDLNEASKQKEQKLIYGLEEEFQAINSVDDPEILGFEKALRRNHERCRAMNLLTDDSTTTGLEELCERPTTPVARSDVPDEQRATSKKGIKRDAEVEAASDELSFADMVKQSSNRTDLDTLYEDNENL